VEPESQLIDHHLTAFRAVLGAINQLANQPGRPGRGFGHLSPKAAQYRHLVEVIAETPDPVDVPDAVKYLHQLPGEYKPPALASAVADHIRSARAMASIAGGLEPPPVVDRAAIAADTERRRREVAEAALAALGHDDDDGSEPVPFKEGLRRARNTHQNEPSEVGIS
jgi:hypothetical protein